MTAAQHPRLWCCASPKAEHSKLLFAEFEAKQGITAEQSSSLEATITIENQEQSSVPDRCRIPTSQILKNQETITIKAT